MPIAETRHRSLTDRKIQKEAAAHMSLIAFVRESNAIEGIHREPAPAELRAHETLLALDTVGFEAVYAFQAAIAPGNPLREHRI